jgi:hypothetical protein
MVTISDTAMEPSHPTRLEKNTNTFTHSFPVIAARARLASALMTSRPSTSPGRAQYSTTMRSSTSVTPGADQAAATASSCSAHELTAPARITVP